MGEGCSIPLSARASYASWGGGSRHSSFHHSGASVLSAPESAAACSGAMRCSDRARVRRARKNGKRQSGGQKNCRSPVPTSSPPNLCIAQSPSPMSRVPSLRSLDRLAETAAELGLFIIPAPPTHGEEPAQPSVGATGDEASCLRVLTEDDGSNASSATGKTYLTGMSTLPSAGPTSSASLRWNAALEKLRQEQQKEEKKEVSKREQRRLGLRQRHHWQVETLQELVRHMEKLNPAVVNHNIAEPLNLLRKVMGAPGAPEAEGVEGEVQGRDWQSQNSSSSLHQPTGHTAGKCGRQSKLSANDEALDSGDLSLPPLCGNLGLGNRDSVSIVARTKQEACTLAQSCNSRLVCHCDSRCNSGSTLSDGLLEAGDRLSVQETGVAKEVSCVTIHQLWKKNLNSVRSSARTSGTHRRHKDEGEGSRDHAEDEAGRLGGATGRNVGEGIISYGEALSLSIDLDIPIERVARASLIFARHDRRNIPDDQAEAICREMHKVLYTGATKMPQHLISSCVSGLSGRARFRDTLKAMSQHCGPASFVPSEAQRTRDLARQWGVTAAEVEDLKDTFERFDTNRTGHLDFNQFKSLLHLLMKVPTTVEIPDARALKYWKEIESSNQGKIGFEGFFSWHKRCFSVQDASSRLSCLTYANFAGAHIMQFAH